LNYEHTIFISFILAVQKEDLKVATNLMNYDPYLRYIATLAIKGKREMKVAPKEPKKEATSPDIATAQASPTPAQESMYVSPEKQMEGGSTDDEFDSSQDDDGEGEESSEDSNLSSCSSDGTDKWNRVIGDTIESKQDDGSDDDADEGLAREDK
jgi:hypothetical protein